MLEPWQLEWDEFPENKLHRIFPHLKDCNACPWTNRKEEFCDMSSAHWLFLYYTHSFLLKGKEPPMRIACDERLTIEHILLTCSDFIKIRESHFTAQTLHALF